MLILSAVRVWIAWGQDANTANTQMLIRDFQYANWIANMQFRLNSQRVLFLRFLGELAA